MVIIGIAIAGVSISLDVLRGRDTQLALERLRWVLEATAERARLRGTPLAFEQVADGYRFSQLYPDGRWLPFEAPPVFTEKTLPAELSWGELRASGQRAQRIVFGTRAPHFTLAVHTPQGLARYQGTPTGRVRMAAPGQPAP